MKNKILLILSIVLIFQASCSKDENEIDDPLNVDFPVLPDSGDNPRTAAGVHLGRMLFYDKKLSRTNTIACASCHHQDKAFSDPDRFSTGVNGQLGTRQSMALFNLGYASRAGGLFFWDGRVSRLRHQSLLPIQDSLEMDESLQNVVVKLSNELIYREQFNMAFGDSIITEQRIGLAFEQFLTSIVSNNSKYDKFKRGAIELTASEKSGEQLFIEKGCDNCHRGFNFDDDAERFLNNGLDNESEMTDFGRELVTGSNEDRAKFKVPSLRNIANTAPYMHDGRFNTLEEVLKHYDRNGIKSSSTLAGALRLPVNISSDERRDIINFLKTLTDDELLTNPILANPF